MPDTYDRRIQLGASRRRLEDAEALHQCKRWRGSIYLGGYAIECSLKSLICHYEEQDNFKETTIFKNKKEGVQGSELHNLTKLLEKLPSIQRRIALDRTSIYRDAWKTVSSLWRSDELRYSDKLGDEKESEKFIEAVKKLHEFILSQQGK